MDSEKPYDEGTGAAFQQRTRLSGCKYVVERHEYEHEFEDARPERAG
jgi:hypothetical protein